MKKLTPPALAAFVLDLAILVVCILHLPSIESRAHVPFEVTEDRERVVVSSILDNHASSVLSVGDVITNCNAESVGGDEFIEFTADRESIGNTLRIGFRRGNENRETSVVLIPYYTSLRFTVITGFVGFAFWLIGFFILWNRPDEHVARVLHWSIIFMSATIFLTQARIDPTDFFLVFKRELLLFAYPMAGATFLYFTTLYPRPKLGPGALKGPIILGSAFLIAAVAVVLFSKAVVGGGAEAFNRFQLSYDILHFMLFLYGIGTIASMVYSYVVSESREERRKLQWILWGFVAGPTPFIGLIIIPQLLFSTDLVPEEYATLFMVLVPLCLAISFLKYRLLDIGVLINRSVVYTVLTIFIGTIYAAAVLLVVSAVGGKRISDEYLLVIAFSLVVAIALNPLRLAIQRFVNTTLFPARMRYRESVRMISSEFHKVISVEQLFNASISMLAQLLPISSSAVYSYKGGSMVLQQADRANPIAKFLLSEQHARDIGSSRVYTVSSAVNVHRQDIDTTKEGLLRKLGFAVGIPFLGESGQLLGMLLVNPRAETRRLDEGEIDLLLTIVHQTEETLERLQLAERFILEREGKRHAEELNMLKSYFVSSVSHELRTPLTSIRMFADTLRETKAVKAKQSRDYLDIIVGETDRLARLINNVLDFSRIEAGLKEFHFVSVDFHDVVNKSVDAVRYQVEMNGGNIRVKIPKALPRIDADADALEEVIVNLLSNALKYSPGKKEISLTVRKDGRYVECDVGDKGLGISETDLQHIFERFFRVKDDRSNEVGGAGIGLSVVQHIVEAHGGTITAHSTFGKGSTFRVRLPITSNHEDHTHR